MNEIRIKRKEANRMRNYYDLIIVCVLIIISIIATFGQQEIPEIPICHSMTGLSCYPTGTVEMRVCCRTSSMELEFHVHKCMVEIWRKRDNSVVHYKNPTNCIEYNQRCIPINWICY